VIKLNLEQVFQIFDVREYLEGLSVRLAVERNPPHFWQGTMDLYHGPIVRYVVDGDFESYLAEIDAFRRKVIAAAHNPILADALDRIYDQSRAIIDRTLVLPGRVEIGLTETQVMLSAMRSGDALEAERLRRDNIRSQRAFVERYQNLVL
jgi:DNA-binding GntR family transcriptional regulator